MPSQSTLFNINMEPVYEFGSAHRNTISWSPHGRFLCIAGFGNLAGEMDFYDVLRFRKIGTNSAHAAVSHGWSPDSRYFLTSTLSPRMNVDNGLKIFKYNGIGPVFEKPFDVAYDIFWKPEPDGVYPSRGPSPARENVPLPTKNATTKEVYRPPAYRAPGSSHSAFGDLLKRDDGPTGKVKAAKQSTSTLASSTSANASSKQQRVVPGMARPSEAPLPSKNLKNQKSSAMKINPGSSSALLDSKPGTFMVAHLSFIVIITLISF